MGSHRVPVRTYHSHRVAGDGYALNDHVALALDLRTVRRLGFHIVPLFWVVEWLLGARSEASLERAVALTFDDGADLDVRDVVEPEHGPQRRVA